MEWQFTAPGQSAVSINYTWRIYQNFINTTLLQEFGKGGRRADEKKNAEKVESPLPTMKLEPTITESRYGWTKAKTAWWWFWAIEATDYSIICIIYYYK